MDLALIGYCGVDCATCADYTSNTCPGCRQSTWDEGDACMPVACCQRQGITCCGHCPSFPCSDMADFYQETEGHRQAFERMSALRAE